MSEKPTYYSATAAAQIMNQPRANVIFWAETGHQGPDALLAPAQKDEKPQPVWTEQTLQSWGTQQAEEPPTFYSAQAAILLTGMARSTFNTYRAKEPIPADAHLVRSTKQGPLDLWTRETLEAWSEKVTATLRRSDPQSLHLFTPEESARLLKVTHGTFTDHLDAHPLTPDALLVSPPKALFSEQRLRAWAKETELPVRRKKAS